MSEVLEKSNRLGECLPLEASSQSSRSARRGAYLECVCAMLNGLPLSGSQTLHLKPPKLGIIDCQRQLPLASTKLWVSQHLVSWETSFNGFFVVACIVLTHYSTIFYCRHGWSLIGCLAFDAIPSWLQNNHSAAKVLQL